MRTRIVMQEIPSAQDVKQFRRSTPTRVVAAATPGQMQSDRIDYVCPKCGSVVMRSETRGASTGIAAECGSCGTTCALP